MSKQIIKMTRDQLTTFANTLGWDDRGEFIIDDFILECSFDIHEDGEDFIVDLLLSPTDTTFDRDILLALVAAFAV